MEIGWSINKSSTTTSSGFQSIIRPGKYHKPRVLGCDRLQQDPTTRSWSASIPAGNCWRLRSPFGVMFQPNRRGCHSAFPLIRGVFWRRKLSRSWTLVPYQLLILIYASSSDFTILVFFSKRNPSSDCRYFLNPESMYSVDSIILFPRINRLLRLTRTLQRWIIRYPGSFLQEFNKIISFSSSDCLSFKNFLQDWSSRKE